MMKTDTDLKTASGGHYQLSAAVAFFVTAIGFGIGPQDLADAKTPISPGAPQTTEEQAISSSAQSALIASPTVDTSVGQILTFWQPDTSPGSAPHPVLIAYTGEVDIHGSGVVVQDTTGPTRFLRLSDITAAPDSITTWLFRLQAIPIDVALLNDSGVNFHVIDLNPYGADIRMGQGAVHDMYFWGAAAAGSPAADGDKEQGLVVNQGMPPVYPDRAPSAATGQLILQQQSFESVVSSSASDPVANTSYDGDVVSEVAAPQLRAAGGDFSGNAQFTFSLILPANVHPVGVAVIQPSIPGIDVTINTTFPNAGTQDFHQADVTISVTTNDPWLESRSSGPLSEWTFQPYIISYGTRHRQLPADRVDAAYLQARLPTGVTVKATPVGGDTTTLHSTAPGQILQLVAVGDRQLVSLSDAPPSAQVHSNSSARGGTQNTFVSPPIKPQLTQIDSPEVRGFFPAGLASAQIADVYGVPSLVNLRTDDHPFGDFAVPHIIVDGTRADLGWPQLLTAPQVTPFGVSVAEGFDVDLLFQAGTTVIWLEYVLTSSPFGDLAQLLVLDVHSSDPNAHDVQVDWYSRPRGDTITSDGQPVPMEILTHEELNGGDGINHNVPDITGLNSVTGAGDNYLLLAPIELYQGSPNGAKEFFALLRDHDGFEPDPVAAVNGETLTGSVGVYMRTDYSALPQNSDFFRGWIYVYPVGSAPPPVEVVSTVSRQVHGNAGTFDIDLPLSGAPGIECRAGEVAGDYTMIFNFANALSSVGSASLTSGTGSISSSAVGSDPHQFILNLTGVDNAQRITATLANVSDSAGNNSGSILGQMALLLGDVNGTGRVDAADVSSVRQQTLQTVNASNFRNDINTTGRIDAADVSTARQQTLTSLP